MIKKLDQYHISNNRDEVNHNIIDKINEIIDFLNDTYLMKVKDGQFGTVADDSVVLPANHIVSGVIYDCAIDSTTCDLDEGTFHLNGDAECPHCGSSFYMEGSSMTTLANYPPIWKDGVNVNPDRNKTTTHCKCLNCGEEFDI